MSKDRVKRLPYVAHDCPRCDARFLYPDLTNCQKFPPTWAYCPKCCKELGIDFKKQSPYKNRKLKNSSCIGINEQEEGVE